jgi:hypothetical protein
MRLIPILAVLLLTGCSDTHNASGTDSVPHASSTEASPLPRAEHNYRLLGISRKEGSTEINLFVEKNARHTELRKTFAQCALDNPAADYIALWFDTAGYKAYQVAADALQADEDAEYKRFEKSAGEVNSRSEFTAEKARHMQKVKSFKARSKAAEAIRQNHTAAIGSTFDFKMYYLTYKDGVPTASGDDTEDIPAAQLAPLAKQ